MGLLTRFYAKADRFLPFDRLLDRLYGPTGAPPEPGGQDQTQPKPEDIDLHAWKQWAPPLDRQPAGEPRLTMAKYRSQGRGRLPFRDA